MAISIDWGTGVITVNQTDPELTFVSGDTYELDTNAFRLTLKALEEGAPFVRTNKHNTIVTIDGINYVRSFEIINGYTIQFLPDSSWRVRMDGASNNNVHSEGILVQNQVQVIPSNSAGNTVTETGTSGLTASESQALLDIDSNVDTLQTDVSDLDDGVFGQKALIDAVDKYTDPGYMILWDELGVLLGHKEIYEEHVLAGYPANIGYTRAGKGYAFEGPLTAGMPPP